MDSMVTKTVYQDRQMVDAILPDNSSLVLYTVCCTQKQSGIENEQSNTDFDFQ